MVTDLEILKVINLRLTLNIIQVQIYFEPRTAAIKDFWEKVGLKTNVKLVEFGKYNEDLANASKDMEVYFRSWAGGTDPDPSDLYHTDRPQNEMRTVLPKSDQYLDDALDSR